MTIGDLIITIGALCQPIDNKDIRIDCIEHYSNCMILSDGRIEEKDLFKCAKQWKIKLNEHK